MDGGQGQRGSLGSPSEVVLLTGASSGLGLAIARRLIAEPRYRVILTARQSSLRRFAEAGIVESERVWLRPLDVTQEQERIAVVDEAESRWGGVDVLINNAGVAYRAVMEHVTERERLAQMGVNFRSPMELTRLVLPGMRNKLRGRIVNISSVGGMMAMPTMAVYSASKFALEGATESLWYEVRPWGIQVTLIEPGFIHSTSFQHVVFTELSRKSYCEGHEAYAAHYRFMGPFIARLMDLSRATPDTVARKVMRTIRRRRAPLRVSATLDAFIFSGMRRFFPRFLYHYALYALLPHVRSWGPRQGELPPPSDSSLPPPADEKEEH